MKTICKELLSIYIFDNAVSVSYIDYGIEVGPPDRFIIAGLNETNSDIYTGVTPPEDWESCKYLFDGVVWEVSPDWVEPVI